MIDCSTIVCGIGSLLGDPIVMGQCGRNKFLSVLVNANIFEGNCVGHISDRGSNNHGCVEEYSHL